MAVLVEALCLVIPKLSLDLAWPGGSDAFLQAMCADDCPSRRVMHDERLASISFFTPEDVEVVAEQLRAVGLVDLEAPAGPFLEFALVDQLLGPVLPAPWLTWRTEDGVTGVWLADEEPGDLSVPDDWTPEQSRALVRTDIRDEPGRMFKLADEEGGVEVWLDTTTGAICHGVARPQGGTTSPEPTEPDATQRDGTTAAPSTVRANDDGTADDEALDLDTLLALIASDEELDVPLARPIENSYVVPGSRLVAGEYPGVRPGASADALEEKLQEFLDVGIDTFVDLTHPADGLAPYADVVKALGRDRAMKVGYFRVPIRDLGTCTREEMASLLELLDTLLEIGRTVYVHCWGGVGRTGLVVGCWLRTRGLDGEAALREVGRLFGTMAPAKVRRHASWGSPQTEGQRAMVRDWGAAAA